MPTIALIPTAAHSLVHSLVHSLGPGWLNPETLLTTLGTVAFWVVLGIVFAECGLLVGFFLPGDSLLFIVGLFIASGAIQINIALACVLLFVAALAGNIVGYWIGAAAGPAIFRRQDSRLFKQKYVDHTHTFFERYGNRAIVLARFVPIVRTFITVVAGVGRMDFRRYLMFSAIGAVLWAGGVTLLGYFLGNIEFVKSHIELILILVVVLSVVPLIVEFVRHRRQRAA
ncbi:MAG: VTT domain-containing protein [Actinomycetes bacterium]